MSKLNNFVRWCLRRCKRVLLFLSFLLVISVLVIFAFVTLNQNHAQLSGIKAHLQGGHGLGPDTHDIWSITKGNHLHRKDATQFPRQRPMVQFFPDKSCLGSVFALKRPVFHIFPSYHTFCTLQSMFYHKPHYYWFVLDPLSLIYSCCEVIVLKRIFRLVIALRGM